MATSLYRIVKYGFQGFWRNGWLSVATTVIMVLTLLVFISLIIFGMLTNTAIDILKEKIDISVYFKTTTAEDSILQLKRSLESLSEVKNVEYLSRDQALAQFKERHKDDPTISEALAVLEKNPLSASLDIKANNPKDYPVIAAYLNNQNLKDIVEQVTYNQNQLVINRLAKIIDTAEKIGIALIIILSVVAVLVTLNTIMLTIHSAKEEIGIMRLVGASNAFIRGPYIIQGIIYGITAAILSLILITPFISIASPYVEILMPETNLTAYFYGNLWSLFGYQVLFGVILGIVSSFIAVRRYLRV